MRPEDMVDQILGHYHILRPLGYGGTATVFLAKDINLKREVAIKVFIPQEGATESFIRRFAREARVLANLDHPHILPVYDYGEGRSFAYLVMPLMAGGSLRDRIREQGALPIIEAIQYIIQVLSALQYAHTRNLIHRDIKPGNMLFKSDDTLMLSDFGLVKVIAKEQIRFLSEDLISSVGGTINGTPEYMAPEQIAGEPVPVSDIYGTGAVLYELLTGQRLFTAENPMSILMQQVYQQPRPIRSLNPRVSPTLEAIIMHALEKDLNKRYQSADEFRSALQAALHELSPSAPVPQKSIIEILRTVPLPPSAHPLPPTQLSPALLENLPANYTQRASLPFSPDQSSKPSSAEPTQESSSARLDHHMKTEYSTQEVTDPFQASPSLSNHANVSLSEPESPSPESAEEDIPPFLALLLQSSSHRAVSPSSEEQDITKIPTDPAFGLPEIPAYSPAKDVSDLATQPPAQVSRTNTSERRQHISDMITQSPSLPVPDAVQAAINPHRSANKYAPHQSSSSPNGPALHQLDISDIPTRLSVQHPNTSRGRTDTPPLTEAVTHLSIKPPVAQGRTPSRQTTDPRLSPALPSVKKPIKRRKARKTLFFLTMVVILILLLLLGSLLLKYGYLQYLVLLIERYIPSH